MCLFYPDHNRIGNMQGRGKCTEVNEFCSTNNLKYRIVHENILKRLNCSRY